MRRLSVALRLFIPALLCCVTAAAGADRPNVLFIAVDDLRPQLGCYGQAEMHTPNIDLLAASGTLFERAYCMVPTCGASRASLMTGIRPSPNRFTTHLTRAQVDAPGIKTMNTHFRENGYYTASLGKVFHHPDDNAKGWSEPARRPKGKSYHLPDNVALAASQAKKEVKNNRGPAYEAADAPESDYPDGELTTMAIEKLGQLAKQDEPFFLAVGFLKPHLPFVCPKKYWDLYDHDAIQLPETYHRPENAPDEAIHSSGELRAYAGIPANGPVDDETARNLIHGYYACVSFTDSNIGKLLQELDRLKLTDNTIVVLWGDHGWNLGEHTLWCKHSCFETSMQIPLIIRAPNLRGGQRVAALTETIDIYPTLCDLTGLESPAHLAGESLLRLLHDPAMSRDKPAIGRFQSGDTIRTDDFRFTEYSTKQGKTTATMLYDHRTDAAEDNNIVHSAAAASDVKRLDQQLDARKGKDSDVRRKKMSSGQ